MGLAALGMASPRRTGVLAHWSGRPPEGPYLTVACSAPSRRRGRPAGAQPRAVRAREQAERMCGRGGAAGGVRIRERSEREERDHDLRSAIFAWRRGFRALGSDHRSGGGRRWARRRDRHRARKGEGDVAAADRGSRRFAVADALLPIISLELARASTSGWSCPSSSKRTDRRRPPPRSCATCSNNARRYAPRAPVRVTAERSGDRVLVRVADPAPGSCRGPAPPLRRGMARARSRPPRGHRSRALRLGTPRVRTGRLPRRRRVGERGGVLRPVAARRRRRRRGIDR